MAPIYVCFFSVNDAFVEDNSMRFSLPLLEIDCIYEFVDCFETRCGFWYMKKCSL